MPTVAQNFGGDPLRTLAEGAGRGKQCGVRVRMRVDESGRDHASLRVEDLGVLRAGDFSI